MIAFGLTCGVVGAALLGYLLGRRHERHELLERLWSDGPLEVVKRKGRR